MAGAAPTWLDKVQFVKFFLSNTCEAPGIVYLETALPALGDAILTLLDFGMDDVVRGYFKPRGLRSARHGRKGNKGGKKGKGGIPEIGEIIGKNLPGASTVAGRHVSDGVKNMWILDGLVQRALYYFLIIDVVTEFAYAWSSAIARDDRSYCETTAPA